MEIRKENMIGQGNTAENNVDFLRENQSLCKKLALYHIYI